MVTCVARASLYFFMLHFCICVVRASLPFFLCISVFVIAVLDSVTWPGQAWWHLMLKGVCISLRERYDVTISPQVHSHHDQIQIQIHNTKNTKSQKQIHIWCHYLTIHNSCDPGKLPNLVPKGICFALNLVFVLCTICMLVIEYLFSSFCKFCTKCQITRARCFSGPPTPHPDPTSAIYTENILYKHGSALNDKSKVQCKHLNGVLCLALCHFVVCLVYIIW